MTVVGNTANTDETIPTENVAAETGEKATAAPAPHAVEQAMQPGAGTKDGDGKPQNVFDDVDSPSTAPGGEDHEEIEQVSQLPGVSFGENDEKVKINGNQYRPSDLEITPEEKAAFIDSMISGERYRQTYSLFGGRLTVTIRSRTSDETHAMYSYIRHTLANKEGESALSRVEGDMAYVPLVAQIEEVNGVRYPEMKAPLTYEQSGDDINEPGWYKDFKAWKAKPEGLTSALISYIQLFEYKYWTMTKEAGNKNFWTSDTSTEE